MVDITAPYAAGADGVIIWGYTGGNDGITAQGGPQLQQYLNYVKTETGPLVESFHKQVAACGAKYCSGHGRCVDVTPAAAGAGCRCFDGFTGPTCKTDDQDLLQQTAYYRTPATLSAKTDDLDIAPPSAKKHIDWYIGHSWNWHTRESQQPSSYAGGGSCLQAAHPRLVPTCSQQ